MVTKILFNSEKGGTGKTTTSTLAAAMLAARGQRVLLIDLDAQAHATVSFGFNKAPGIYDVMVREANINEWMEAYHVPEDRYMPPGTRSKGDLFLLPGNGETHGIPIQVRDQEALDEALYDADGIDTIIIDSAPSDGMLLTYAWFAVDHVVIPAKMEYLSIEGIAQTINRSQKFDVNLLGILPNLVLDNTRLHNNYLDMLHGASEKSGWHVFPPLRQRIVWAEASSVRHMLVALEGEVGKARIEAMRFVDELVKRLAVVAHG